MAPRSPAAAPVTSPSRPRHGDLLLDLATPADDAELRRLLRENPMEGAIRVSLEREPSVALAAAVEGERHATVVAREPMTGRVVGMGSRSVLPAYVGGAPCRLGYLSQLRLDRGHRGRLRAVAGGYALLQGTRRPDEAPFDVTTIVADNRPARRLLEARLPELPAYREIAPFVTVVLQTWRRRRRRFGRLERGAPERLPEIAACLDRHRRRHEVAPRWTVADLASPERCQGLSPTDFFLAVVGGEVVGCLALWDQTGFKQVVVRGYAPRLDQLRPWLNRAAGLLGTPRLPEPGEALPHAYLSHVAVDEDDPVVFEALAEAAYDEARARGLAYVVAGFAAGHPFLDVLKKYRPRRYESVLYAVEWDEPARAALDRLAGRPPHLEVALL